MAEKRAIGEASSFRSVRGTGAKPFIREEEKDWCRTHNAYDALRIGEEFMSPPPSIESVIPSAREAAIASLHRLLGERLSRDLQIRQQHGKDASYHPCVP
ncbi:MAG: hypothetical protein JO334_17980, partial [Verrucomicrobia bacterium]|nr:hypothetical protein [Verrucomicrobiota bacterium]